MPKKYTSLIKISSEDRRDTRAFTPEHIAITTGYTLRTVQRWADTGRIPHRALPMLRVFLLRIVPGTAWRSWRFTESGWLHNVDTGQNFREKELAAMWVHYIETTALRNEVNALRRQLAILQAALQRAAEARGPCRPPWRQMPERCRPLEYKKARI